MDVVEIYTLEDAAKKLQITSASLRQAAIRSKSPVINYKGFRLIKTGSTWFAVKAPENVHVQGSNGPFLQEELAELAHTFGVENQKSVTNS